MDSEVHWNVATKNLERKREYLQIGVGFSSVTRCSTLFFDNSLMLNHIEMLIEHL